MSVREDLIAMREWLTPPGRWCQGQAWSDKRGYYTSERAKVASACLYGAYLIAAGEEKFSNCLVGTPRYEDMMATLNEHCPPVDPALSPHPFVAFNDAKGRTKKDILALLDRCIADCDPPIEHKTVIAPVMERELEPA